MNNAKYRAAHSPARRETSGPYADWIVESDDGLLCEGMCESEAVFVADAVNSHATLTTQLAALTAALVKYGSHDDGCMKVDWRPPRGCTCGFDAALKATKGAA